MAACGWIAVTRVQDYWHNHDDILAGAIIGGLAATACYTTRFAPGWESQATGLLPRRSSLAWRSLRRRSSDDADANDSDSDSSDGLLNGRALLVMEEGGSKKKQRAKKLQHQHHHRRHGSHTRTLLPPDSDSGAADT